MILEYLTGEELVFLLRHCDRWHFKEELDCNDQKIAENLVSFWHKANGVLTYDNPSTSYIVNDELFNRDLLLEFLIKKLFSEEES